MYVSNLTDDYDKITFINRTNFENEDNIINIFIYLLLPVPSSIVLFFLTSLMIYTLTKSLRTIKSYWINLYFKIFPFVESFVDLVT